MKRNILIALLTMMLCAGAVLLAGCGGDDFATYMKGQPAMRSSIDAQLAILSGDAKGSVQYKEDGAEVSVDYYALTQAELEGEETEKSIMRIPAGPRRWMSYCTVTTRRSSRIGNCCIRRSGAISPDLGNFRAMPKSGRTGLDLFSFKADTVYRQYS